MPRLALDSVNYGSLASSRWPHQIGYINGHVSAWSAEEIAETRASGRLLALVDVLGTMPLAASVLDFERGDVQSPTVVRAWLQARNQFRGDGTVYCAVASIPTVVSGLRGERCNLWVADLTADAEPPFTMPEYPGLPAGVRVIARQFVLTPRSGGPYDMSIIYADDWHPEQGDPAGHAAARISAAAELGPYAVAAVRASSTGAAAPEIPGQLAIGEADPAPDFPGGATSSGTPSPSTPSPVSSSSPATASPGELTSAATAAAPPDPAATAEPDSAWRIGNFTMPASTMTAQPPPPLIITTPPAPTPAPVQPVAVLGPDGRDSGRTVFEPAAPLNHDFIRRVLNDTGDVAREFRRGGWTNIATELERVCGMAWEIGGAIRAAGLLWAGSRGTARRVSRRRRRNRRGCRAPSPAPRWPRRTA